MPLRHEAAAASKPEAIHDVEDVEDGLAAGAGRAVSSASLTGAEAPVLGSMTTWPLPEPEPLAEEVCADEDALGAGWISF